MIGDEAHYHLMRRAYSLLIPAAAFLYMKVGSHGARGDYPRRSKFFTSLDGESMTYIHPTGKLLFL